MAGEEEMDTGLGEGRLRISSALEATGAFAGPLDIDVGNLTANDPSPIDPAAFGKGEQAGARTASDCLLIGHLCARTHSPLPHPPPWLGHSFLSQLDLTVGSLPNTMMLTRRPFLHLLLLSSLLVLVLVLVLSPPPSDPHPPPILQHPPPPLPPPPPLLPPIPPPTSSSSSLSSLVIPTSAVYSL